MKLKLLYLTEFLYLDLVISRGPDFVIDSTQFRLNFHFSGFKLLVFDELVGFDAVGLIIVALHIR